MARFEQVAPNHGVDSVAVGREWMMVPQRGTNLVRLTDGDGFTVAEKGKRRLTIVEVTRQFTEEAKRELNLLALLIMPRSRIFSVRGAIPGETRITATHGRANATLAVSVHPRREYGVAFYFLQDRSASGQVTARTAFAPSIAGSWVAGLNRVFGRQANIWFTLRRAELLPLAGLRATFGDTADKARLADLQKQSGAPITVFLAGPKIQTDVSEPHGFYDQTTKAIVVGDQFVKQEWGAPQEPMLKTIAHEIAHYLNHARGAGGGHDFHRTNGYNSDILNTLDGSDIKISRQRVLDWNPW